jgi:hypothetical protein
VEARQQRYFHNALHGYSLCHVSVISTPDFDQFCM